MLILSWLPEKGGNLEYAEMEKNLLHVLKLSKIYQEGNGRKKKLQLTSLLGLSLFIMTACATNGTASDITADSTDFWSKFVYFCWNYPLLSFDISIGVGIILFTILIRTILLPVFQTQMVASRKMQEAQPRIKALREQYPGRDMEK